VGLDLRDSVGADPAQSRNLVLAPAALELVQPRELRIIGATISLPSRRASIPRSSQYA